MTRTRKLIFFLNRIDNERRKAQCFQLGKTERKGREYTGYTSSHEDQISFARDRSVINKTATSRDVLLLGKLPRVRTIGTIDLNNSSFRDIPAIQSQAQGRISANMVPIHDISLISHQQTEGSTHLARYIYHINP